MTVSSNPTRVVIIGDPGPTQEQIIAALGSQPEFYLADPLISEDRLVREVRASDPDLILVDHQLGGKSTLDIIDDLAIQFPEAAIITILPGDDPVRAQQVMLAGARAFIFHPFTQINLLSTVRRVRDLEGRQRQSQKVKAAATLETTRPLRTIAVYSPRGGVGTSTVAINMALTLQVGSGMRVLLMEGKLFFGHLDVMLNIRPQNTIADLIPHANNLDEALVHDVVVRHASGLNVLLGPSDIQVAQGIHPDDLYNVFTSVQRLYDLVVIDAGSFLSENTVTLMDAADRILLVTNPDLASLHDASRFIQIMRSLSYPPEKLLILLNRAGMPGGVKLRDIETAMHNQLFAQIPYDPDNALRSVNRGVPLVYRYPRSAAARGFRQLAQAIGRLSTSDIGVDRPAQPVEKSHREVLIASSRLG